jgi:transcriptional regulator with XRE-family HTH domain
MTKTHPYSHSATLPLVQRALGSSQDDLARRFNVSRRTISRWSRSGGMTLLPDQLRDLVKALHTKDADLAGHIATRHGQTLESLGVVVHSAPEPPARVEVARPTSALLVDSVVCAAADAMSTAPDSIRPALLAAFTRAAALELTATDIAKALTPSPSTPKPRRTP